jgi:hypothetical protein
MKNSGQLLAASREDLAICGRESALSAMIDLISQLMALDQFIDDRCDR